ncbi:hypothetical protein SAMN04487949_1890 [Halogranum gelatinilyticum]|uniref:tRNA-guanine family transglycosylase n=1 Tax=Halogranum gelatinilyticum TaxID=660521 RepID=A0A1G9TSP1_9EURY|nr:hypothetical protein [Halogranum gelatinilyticum]SDM50568.1 hypothetical protein SAMN04487949_1890 [Halogranum gelatinilyticum]
MFENSLHYYTFGEYKEIERAAPYYDSLIVSSHFVVTETDKIAGTLSNLQPEQQIDFYVQPYLPEFRKGDNFRKSNGELRSWASNLAEYYGPPISDVLENRSNLNYFDFSREDQKKIIEKSCDLQLDLLDEASENKLGRYLDSVASLTPRALVPWYVKINSRPDIRANEEIINYAAEYSDCPVKPCFYVDKSFIHTESNRREIVRAVEEAPVREVFLWIDGFDKRDVSIGELCKALDLVERVSQRGVDPHMMYSDYFANLMAFFGLRGVSFGIEHGESKSEKTDSGGGSGDSVRYYYNPVKEFLNVYDVEDLGTDFDDPLCECQACDPVMNSWSDIFQLADDRKARAQHYITTRDGHRETVTNETLDDLVGELWDGDDKYQEALDDTDHAANANHLRKWATAIEHYVEEEKQRELSDYSLTTTS